jgi:hypothetical protein
MYMRHAALWTCEASTSGEAPRFTGTWVSREMPTPGFAEVKLQGTGEAQALEGFGLLFLSLFFSGCDGKNFTEGSSGLAYILQRFLWLPLPISITCRDISKAPLDYGFQVGLANGRAEPGVRLESWRKRAPAYSPPQC